MFQFKYINKIAKYRQNNLTIYFKKGKHLKNHCWFWLQAWNSKTFTPWKESYDKPRQHIKKQNHHLADKILYSHSYGFPRSRVWMWELDHKKGWALKNWCFYIVMLEKTLGVSWSARRSNQTVWKEFNLECSLEGLILKLKLQHFGH